MDWAAANEAAANLGDGDCGLTDQSASGNWRLPTPEEWQWSSETVLQGDSSLAAATWWSSATDGSQPTYARAAQLHFGLISSAKLAGYRAWPVRGGHNLPGGDPPAHPDRYQPMNGGIIKDLVTGYEWQRCSVGQIWNASTLTCDGSALAIDWATAKGTWPATATWRLPTIAELRTLVYCSSGTPILIDMTADGISCSGAYQKPTIVSWAFPNTPDPSRNTFYWSSSPGSTHDPNDPIRAWYVSTTIGLVAGTFRENPFYVRLVRGGQ